MKINCKSEQNAWIVPGIEVMFNYIVGLLASKGSCLQKVRTHICEVNNCYAHSMSECLEGHSLVVLLCVFREINLHLGVKFYNSNYLLLHNGISQIYNEKVRFFFFTRKIRQHGIFWFDLSQSRTDCTKLTSSLQLSLLLLCCAVCVFISVLCMFTYHPGTYNNLKFFSLVDWWMLTSPHWPHRPCSLIKELTHTKRRTWQES